MTTRPKFFQLLLKSIRDFQEKWLSLTGIALLTTGFGTFLAYAITKLVDSAYVKNLVPDIGAEEAIEIPMDSALLSGICAQIITALIIGVLGLIMTASLIELLHAKKAKFFDALIFGCKNLWRFILAALYVFWYTFGWLLTLIVGYLMVRFMTQFSKLGLTSVVDMNEANMFEEKADEVINAMMTGVDKWIILGLTVLAVILIFVVVYRSIRVTFTYYALFDKAKIKTVDAASNSIKAVKGRWWLVFLYAVSLSLILTIVMSVIESAGLKITESFLTKEYIQTGLNIILSAIFIPIATAFQYNFYKALKG